MKKTMLSAMVSLLAASVLLGGCTADAGGESESDGAAAEGPNVGGGEEVGEAQQALVGFDFWGVNSNGMAGGWTCDSSFPTNWFHISIHKKLNGTWQYIGGGTANLYNSDLSSVCGGQPYHMYNIYVGASNAGPGEYQIWSNATSPYTAFLQTYTR